MLRKDFRKFKTFKVKEPNLNFDKNNHLIRKSAFMFLNENFDDALKYLNFCDKTYE